jgi:DNA-binding beta-propeller fold protein YncE
MLRFLTCHAAAIITCIALAACGAPAPLYSTSSQNVSAGVPSALAAPSNLNAKAFAGIVYVSDSTTNDLSGCQHGVCRACKTLGSGLASVSINPSAPPPLDSRQSSVPGTVYLADEGGQQIIVMDASCTTTETISDQGFYPLDVAFALDGTLAVMNFESTSFGPGNILFYAPKSKKPRVAKGLLANFYFGGFDSHGNFFNDGVTLSGGPAVGVVAAGSNVDKLAGISGIRSPGGIAVARDGTINIDDQACPCIQIYEGKKHVGTVTLSGAVDPVSFAFNKKNTDVWVADAGTGTVDEYAYPKGGRSIQEFSGFKTPVGVGVLPASQP